MNETEELRAQQIAALIHEREGYERAGQQDRADEVTAELHRLGAETTQTPARPVRAVRVREGR